jgi:DNA-binding NarL/FixJ family response regulator
MKSKILILEKNEHYAERLQKMLISMLDYQVIHVTSELAVVRELTANYVDLIVVGIHQARAKEGLRLIEILLVEKKVVTVAPIMVVSDVQDPAYIQQCVQAGISDYMLYPEDPVEILPRLKNVLNKSGGISEMLVRVSTTF